MEKREKLKQSLMELIENISPEFPSAKFKIRDDGEKLSLYKIGPERILFGLTKQTMPLVRVNYCADYLSNIFVDCYDQKIERVFVPMLKESSKKHKMGKGVYVSRNGYFLFN